MIITKTKCFFDIMRRSLINSRTRCLLLELTAKFFELPTYHHHQHLRSRRQQRSVASTTTSLGPFRTNAEGCTIAVPRNSIEIHRQFLNDPADRFRQNDRKIGKSRDVVRGWTGWPKPPQSPLKIIRQKQFTGILFTTFTLHIKLRSSHLHAQLFNRT